MAIQMRRGLKKDFDPYKMLPGEWAVSIDPSSSNQIVWMCFAPGVCKRMGTYEDFVAQITEATDDIREQYVNEFNAILTDVQSLADTVAANKETVVIAKSDIVDTYIPQIQKYVNDAKGSATTATSKASDALEYSIISKSYAVGGTGTRAGEDTDNAMYYANQAKAQTGDIPTKMSQLENDAGFITAAVDNLINYYKSSQLYTKTEIDAKLSAIPKFAIVAVDSLPTENISETTIYLLKEQESGTNKCSEWVYINNAWEKIGDIDIDLSGYLQKTGDGSNLTETFSQASSLENIASGESHSTIFGKITKAIATLISHISIAATTSVLGHVKVDSAMSSSSENPVQNKVVNSALGNKLATTGDASNTTVAFTEATTMAELATGEKMSTLFGKLKLTVKNVISILTLLGSTDISAIGDGTITGAISTQNSNFAKTITFDNDWMIGYIVTGLGKVLIQVPLNNPEKKVPTLNITSGQIYTPAAGWEDLSNITISCVRETFIEIGGSGYSPNNVTNGNCYLVRFMGSVTL